MRNQARVLQGEKIKFEEAVREKATNMSPDDLVKLGEEMDKEQVPYKFNLDGDFFTQSPWNGFEGYNLVVVYAI